MKIAIASSGLGHVARGVEAWAADLGRALARRGENVTLYKGGGIADAPYERVIPCWQRGAARTERLLHWLPRRGVWRVGLGSAGDVEQNSFALGLLRHLRRERIDILHVQDAVIADVVRKAKWLGLVRSCTVYGLGSKEPVEFQRRFTYLHQLAPWYLDEARTSGAFKPTWTWIPNFVDTDVFQPGAAKELRMELGIPPEGQIVLCVAAIKRDHKRIDYLLEEFAELRRARPELPVWLVIAGAREPQTDELMALGPKLLGDRVRFLVDFPRSRIPELFRIADLFVLCSLREMFGIVLLEATASGLPCLVNDHPVMKWVVGPGGEAIAMSQPGVLATALDRHLTNHGHRQAMARQARQYCIDHFSVDRVVEQMLEYYHFVYRHNRTITTKSAKRRPCQQL